MHTELESQSIFHKFPLLEPMRKRNFFLFWLGFSLTLVTNISFLFAITIEGYRLTGSGTTAGVINSLFQASWLMIMLFAGVLIDRMSRRLIIIIVNLLRSVLLFTLVIIMQSGVLSVEHLYIAAFLMGLASAFDGPASTAILPMLVRRKQIVAANSLLAFASRGGMVGGAIFGSRLISETSTSNAIMVMALTSMFAAFCVSLIIVKEKHIISQPRSVGYILRQLWQGVIYAISVPWLWLTILIFAMLNVTIYGPWRIGLPLLSEIGDGLNLEALYLMGGLGALLVTITLGQLRRVSKPGRVMYMAVIAKGVGILLVGMFGSSPIGLIGALLVGGGAMAFGTTWAVMVQSHVPADKLGRVSSIDGVGSFMLTPIGFAAVGKMGETSGVSSIFLVGGVLTIVLGIFALSLPVFRRLN